MPGSGPCGVLPPHCQWIQLRALLVGYGGQGWGVPARHSPQRPISTPAALGPTSSLPQNLLVQVHLGAPPLGPWAHTAPISSPIFRSSPLTSRGRRLAAGPRDPLGPERHVPRLGGPAGGRGLWIEAGRRMGGGVSQGSGGREVSTVGTARAKWRRPAGLTAFPGQLVGPNTEGQAQPRRPAHPQDTRATEGSQNSMTVVWAVTRAPGYK